MAEPDQSEARKPKTPQQELETLWKNQTFWNNGPQEKMENLPVGMRVISPDTDFSVLRAVLPGAPINAETKTPVDVPVAVFRKGPNPEIVREEAKKVEQNIKDEEIWYVPPEELIT